MKNFTATYQRMTKRKRAVMVITIISQSLFIAGSVLLLSGSILSLVASAIK